MIMVSACLMGKCVRYDGNNCKSENIYEILNSNHNFILICPEVLGGLTTPRNPCEIQDGSAADVFSGNARVINSKGEDKTKEFISGAIKVLKLAKQYKPVRIYLKSKSPSCGIGVIYDGTFTGRLKKGNGIVAQMLIDNGFDVYAL